VVGHHDELVQVRVDIGEVAFGRRHAVLDHETGGTDVSWTVDGQRRGHATVAMKKAEKFLAAASPRSTMR